MPFFRALYYANAYAKVYKLFCLLYTSLLVYDLRPDGQIEILNNEKIKWQPSVTFVAPPHLKVGILRSWEKNALMIDSYDTNRIVSTKTGGIKSRQSVAHLSSVPECRVRLVCYIHEGEHRVCSQLRLTSHQCIGLRIAGGIVKPVFKGY
jgi:hypothetical protein